MMLDNVSYLDDLLAVAIGFSTVMLLLSLVVTSVVQVIQNFFNLRFKNLAIGVQSALKTTIEEEKENSNFPINPNDITLDKIKNDILKPPLNFEVVTKWFDPSTWGKSRINPKKTWIDPDDLVNTVSRVYDFAISKKAADKLKKNFESSYDFLRKRFATFVRINSFAVAFLVAFSFQVDSLDLLKQLSTDPQLRSQALQTAAKLTASEDIQADFVILSYEDVSDSALVLLQKQYPDLGPQLEQASGIGEDREDIVNELKDVLAEQDQGIRKNVVEKYESLLDDLHREEINRGLAKFEKYTGQLALFDIRFMSKDWDYYFNWSHFLGMLITTIFLTFGAPFWFDRLREISKLRDVLRPEDKKDKKDDKPGN